MHIPKSLNKRQHKKIKSLFLLFVFICSAVQPLSAWELDRRTEQFNTEFSYAVFPLPFILPGIGSGIGVGAGLLNINDTHIDAYGTYITGDVQGQALGVADLHLLEKRLILDLGFSQIGKAAFNINFSRGMAGDEDPDDFNQAEISDSTYYGGQLTLTFSERRFETTLQVYKMSSKIERIRDSDGNVLVEIEDSEAEEGTVVSGNIILDLTDDKQDPRSGFRLKYGRNFPQDVESDQINNYVVDVNATAYFPLLTNSTFVLNYFQSDSFVSQIGETDRDKIAIEHKLVPCAPLDAECESAREYYIDTIVAANTYGSASSLGGISRLRSFTSMRFRGAHTRFYGAEFRWNLTDEEARFDIFFMKDLRTAFQLAFFHEIGSIADIEEDLFKEERHSTGLGIRLIMGSGLVYRLDYAVGEEGPGLVLFFSYPWSFF